MKIVKILGGLGNQMFQYALYVALRNTFPDETVKIDTSCFKGYTLHNGFELPNIFTLDCEYATFAEIAKISWPYSHYRVWQLMRRLIPDRKTMCVESDKWPYYDSVLKEEGDKYFDGYWQNERYFIDYRNEIIKAFKFKTLDNHDDNYSCLKILENCNSASIHVRRGDYLRNSLFKNICTLGYYKKAIYMMSRLKDIDCWCVFSDDIVWTKNNIGPILGDIRTIYVEWNNGENSFRDMQLMSMCKNNIIANSSFSWWGAWLNQNENKIVIAPKKWINRPMATSPVCDSWIKISGLV